MADPLVGKVEVKDANGNTIFSVDPDANPVQVILHATDDDSTIQMSNSGRLSLMNAQNNQAVWLRAADARIAVGGTDKAGTLTVSDDPGDPTIKLDAETMGHLTVGGPNLHGWSTSRTTTTNSSSPSARRPPASSPAETAGAGSSSSPAAPERRASNSAARSTEDSSRPVATAWTEGCN
jgi:hypothetical protein